MRTLRSKWEYLIPNDFFGWCVFMYHYVTHTDPNHANQQADQQFIRLYADYVLANGISLPNTTSAEDLLRDMPRIRLRAKVQALRSHKPDMPPMIIALILNVPARRVYNVLKRLKEDEDGDDE